MVQPRHLEHCGIYLCKAAAAWQGGSRVASSVCRLNKCCQKLLQYFKRTLFQSKWCELLVLVPRTHGMSLFTIVAGCCRLIKAYDTRRWTLDS
jgi:hypothetical protein